MSTRHSPATADIGAVAQALVDEATNGKAYITICQGILEMDPVVRNLAPTFLHYCFYGNATTAQMLANKMFDKSQKGLSLTKLFSMAGLQKTKFKFASAKEVGEAIIEAKLAVTALEPVLNILRTRRKNFLAHLSFDSVFEVEKMQRDAALTLPQLNEVLTVGARVANRFSLMWCNAINSTKQLGIKDYEHLFDLASKQYCSEIKAHEAEFPGVTAGLPRPRGCT